MAKSLRAKAKMAGRRKKREQGNYHAADAARVARIAEKLHGKKQKTEGDDDEDEEIEEVEGEETVGDDDAEMVEEPKKISTHGPRDSGRQAWKESRGYGQKRKGTNRQGVVHGKSKAGKPKRRR